MMNLLYIFVGFVSMELVAHLAHKYVMHGFLWSLHRSHHQKTKGFFEWNDLYFLIFATPGIALILTGVSNDFNWMFYLGLGIALYGFTYLVVHDIIIHQRVRWFNHFDNFYFKGLRRAHKAHHANPGKNADTSFGMLWVDKKYYNHVPGTTRKKIYSQIRFFCEHDYPF